MLQTQRETHRDQNNSTHTKILLYKNTIPALEEEEEE
jgi:hypothetical protein